MKWYPLVLAVLIFAPFESIAQYDHFSYEDGHFQTQMSVFVFTENTALKSRPSVVSQDMAYLNQGERVVILVNSMVETERNGIKQYWYEVQHTSDSGKISRGYIQGHDLALGGVTFQIDYRRDLLLIQVSKYNVSEAYTLNAKIVRNGKTVKSIECPFIEFHLNPPLPNYSVSVLKNIQANIDERSEVAEIAFFHKRPDFPSGNLYLVWNGENLDMICETMYLMEPGLFEYDSWVVYPGREGVERGHVMMVEVIKEFDEETESYVVVDRVNTLFRWDGIKVTRLEE